MSGFGPIVVALVLQDDEGNNRGTVTIRRRVDADEVEGTLVEGESYVFELSKDALAGRVDWEPAELFDPDGADARRGRLRVGNRVGTLVLVARSDSTRISAAVEVRAAKLRHEDEYRWMLRDITSDLADVAISRFGATQERYEPEGDAPTAYQRFAFLEAVLRGENFRDAIGLILARPFVARKESTKMVPASRGVRASGRLVRALGSAKSRVLLPQPIGRLQSVPAMLPDETITPTIDNFPNRYVRGVLEEWRMLAQLVLDVLVEEGARRREVSAPVVRGIREATSLVDELDVLLSMGFLRSLEPEFGGPGASTVLHQRAGYREIVKLQQMSQMAGRLTWDGSDLVYGAGHRDVATLYEYWVFLQVGQLVSGLCDVPFDFESLFVQTENGLQLSLRKGRAKVLSGKLRRHGVELDLALWYNRTFRRVAGETWTREMRPDLSLQLSASRGSVREQRWVHFDAKYKVEELAEIIGAIETEDEEEEAAEEDVAQRRALREDLLKMHAYRDAIQRTSGAYVIYPGDEGASEVMRQYHEILPGLGAFALRPAESGKGVDTAALVKFLDDVVSHFASSVSEDARMRYWDRTVRNRPAVPSTAAARTSDLVMLAAPPDDQLVLLLRLVDGVRLSPSMVEIDLAEVRLPGAGLACPWIVAVLDDGVSLFRLALDAPLEVGPKNAIRLTVETVEVPEWLPHAVSAVIGTSRFVVASWMQLVRVISEA